MNTNVGTSDRPDKSTSTPARVLRKAGWLEHFFNIQSREHILGYALVSAKYIPMGYSVDTNGVLRTALEDVISKNAALAARLTPPSPDCPKGEWLALPRVDLNRVVTFFDDIEPLSWVLEQWVITPDIEFPEDMPLWRVFCFPNGTVVFAYDRALGDGQTGVAFHQNLLAALNTIRFPDPVTYTYKISPLPQDTKLLPALEDAIDQSRPFPVLVREYLKSLFRFQTLLPSRNRKKGKAWAGHPAQHFTDLFTRVRFLEYTPSQSSNLTKLAREHSATLTSTIHTLALVILSGLIYAEPANDEYTHVHTVIPLSLRPLTHAPPSALCNHVFISSDAHPLFRTPPSSSELKETFPWDRAAPLAKTLSRKVLPRSPDLLRYVRGRYGEYMQDRRAIPRRRVAGLELADLGAFPDPAAGVFLEPRVDDVPPHMMNRWRIGQMFFVQSDATVGAAIKVHVVGTPEGGLGVSVTWGKSAVDEEFAESFVKALDEGMTTLAR